MDAKYKSKDEWKKLILNLSAQEFQDLCYDILNNNNFKNVKPRGKGGDGGRDVESEFSYTLAKEMVTQKCWFQCKRYDTTPLNYKEFNTEVQKAENQGIDRFIVISNKDMTSDAKTDIEEWNKKHKCQISDWTGTLFLNMLFELPNICNNYFPDEDVPPVVNIKEPKTIIPLSENLGNRFGIEINIDSKDIDINNPAQIGEALKTALLNLNVDINLKSLIYEKISLFFFSINQPETAILFLNKSLDITPKNINALLTKGFILEKIDELNESNEIYDEIFELDEKNLFALNNKSFNLLRQGSLNEALELINHALEVNPNFVLAIKNKIKILKSLDRLDEALDFLTKNEHAFDKSTELMVEKVDLCIEKIDLRTAFDLNKKIFEKEPKNISALNNEGVIYERNAKYQSPEKYLSLALNSFEKVIDLDKESPLGWSNKTAVLMISSKIDEAGKIIEFAYSLFPKSPDILNKKGVFLLNIKEPRKALKYFNSALKRFYRGAFLLNKAQANFQINHYEEALKDLEILLSHEPKNSFAWGLKGECLKKLRRPLWKKCFINAKKYQKTPISLLE